MRHAARTRRRETVTAIISTIALAMAFIIGGAKPVAAQDVKPDRQALVGSWIETVTFPPAFGAPPLKSLGSYHADGTMSCVDQGNVTTTPPAIYSPCHGAWAHLEKRTFAYTSFELISDLSGNLVGYLKFRGIFTVSQSGNDYTGTTFAEILDADGNVLDSVTVVNAGQRIKVELP